MPGSVASGTPCSIKHLEKPRHYIFLPISCFPLHPSNFVKCSHAMYKSSKCVTVSAGIEEVKFHKNGTVSSDKLWYKIRAASHRDNKFIPSTLTQNTHNSKGTEITVFMNMCLDFYNPGRIYTKMLIKNMLTYFQLNQPTRCSNFSSLILVI